MTIPRETTYEPNQTQEGRILELLQQRSPDWVPVYEILALQPRIADYKARIWGLRHKLGYVIENRTKTVDGVKHGWYRLVEAPVQHSLFEEVR